MTGGPLTILQLTHQGGPAGSTQSIFNLSQQLAQRGHRVLVGCRDDVLLARLARAAGLPVVSLAFLQRGALARALVDVLTRERIDVVNSHATLDRRALTWRRWRLPAQGSARLAPGASPDRAWGACGVRRRGAGRPAARSGAGCSGTPPRRVRAPDRPRARFLSGGSPGRAAVPDGRAVAVSARGDGTGVAGGGVGRRR